MEHLIEALEAYTAALRPEGTADVGSARARWHAAYVAADDLDRRGALIFLAAQVKAYQRLVVGA